MRNASVERITRETQIQLTLNLDGQGRYEIDSGIGFLDHMLSFIAVHGQFDLSLCCKGDTRVDDHHSTEDIGICLGEAFRQALGDKRGIVRYASLYLPMDEALVLTALDLSGRGGFYGELAFHASKVGDFDTQLVEEFMIAFARTAGLTLHIRQLAGKNDHHIAEAAFKGLARALKEAVRVVGEEIPSSKGVL